MALQLQNTLTGEKEPFIPLDKNRVTVYLCGPTVYNYAHIGNARPAVVFDVLNRLLRHHYPQVVFARNITDVDDKINKQSQQSGQSIQAISGKYAQAYNEDLASLNVLPPDIEPHATEHIAEMIIMIETLIDKQHAYEQDGHVLFDVTTYPEYGQLSKRDLDDMRAGARVDVADYKKNPGDFVLWKPSTDDLPGWESPWGRGRPGWHIECSAMAAKHLGEVIDIHCGGQDLIFPHHENEIAQSCCANDQPLFARYWLHNGFITMSDQKMSKSLGNIELIRDVVDKHGGEVVRWVLLNAHYRQSANWSTDSIHQAQKTLDRLYRILADFSHIKTQETAPDKELVAALNDDLNTPKAFARLIALAKTLQKTESSAELTEIKGRLMSSAQILGVLQQNPTQWFDDKQVTDKNIKSTIEQLLKEREIARTEKNWQRSDDIRDELDTMGVVIEDTADGTNWHFK
ncbi:cysteine--tRNA ligase [Marinicella gelatinilytica]|uniref:cysteine--tRNA ligase n=1 Tax=Marinicella gelatinilytica TaxID=2996017 RepID=UPI002260FE6A|nr:cysteine--tRNA ligase [Marinicella gelatinilytica]MCX7544396.1 cysteine--tRNA ligase [Marinicella gelatinilytica]